MTNDQQTNKLSHPMSAAIREADTQTNITESFPDEIAHLDEINDKLEEALREADASVERIDKEYMDFKLYMVQNLGDVDPHEMLQNELALKRIDHSGALTVSMREKIAKLIDSPYFARIDFIPQEDQEISAFYIGRFGFSFKNDMLIFDWRAPIASMFYDSDIGPSGYDAPDGRIKGQLTRKRQFKIKNRKMQYTFESSINIHDDILQRELSHTSDEKMKSIISTIQKEQNQIIRNDCAKTLIIQGVAGSGKTSIALHRIAFLLYRFKDRISAKNVTILSPNKVFGDYISNVLPELGEEPIYEWGFTDIAEIQLKGIIDFEADKDPMETEDRQWMERVRFKSTIEFLKLIDRYIQLMQNQVFEAKNYTYGLFSANADWIQTRFNAYSKYPVKQRLKRIAEDIYEQFEMDNIRQYDLPKVRTILKSLNGMLRIKSSIALYKDLYKQMGIASLLVMPNKKTLEWADVSPFLYLHAAFEGLKEIKSISHLVIDEMQDYTPVQYAVLNLLFNCPKTILGDFGQMINPNHMQTLGDMIKLYVDAELVMLNKSYRSTYEIIHFAKKIRNVCPLEAIKRHGEEPMLIQCQDSQDEVQYLKERMNAFLASENVTLGIIMKTNQLAKALSDVLSKSYDVRLLTPESTNFLNGISITSVQMSKGLEFDEVIIPSTSDITYVSEYDRSLLFIACTRAMHRLTLTYTGQLTKLISREMIQCG